MARGWIKLCVSLVAGSSSLLAARVADAKDVEIVAVMWQQDLSAKSTVEQFFGCLTTSSTFGSTWAQEFGLTKVTFKGVYVLSDPCPKDAHLGGNLATLLSDAFDQGKLPVPSPNYSTSYLLYLPSGTQGYDWDEVPACQGTYCGVHGTTSYKGEQFDAAIVPIQCNDCGSVQVTLIGEHEAAEAIANMGTAQYEVGDSCEGPSNETQLDCCGTQYPIQQLSSSKSMSDCQTIDATGNKCGCKVSPNACTQASDCCSGLACGAVLEQNGGSACCTATGGACTARSDCCGALACKSNKCVCNDDGQACLADADCCKGKCNVAKKICGVPDVPDAGTGGGGDAGSGGGNGNGGGSGGDAGAGGNNDEPHGGAGSDAPAGCGCTTVNAEANGFGALGACLALGAVVARRRRR